MLCMQGPGRACRCTVTSRVRHAAPTTTARQDTAAQGRRTADDKNSSFLKNFFLTIFIAARPQNSFEAARMPNYLKRPGCQIIWSRPDVKLFKAAQLPNYFKPPGCQIIWSGPDAKLFSADRMLDYLKQSGCQIIWRGPDAKLCCHPTWYRVPERLPPVPGAATRPGQIWWVLFF